MRDRIDAEEILTRLVEDVRCDSTPDADWDAIEHALMRRVSREGAAPRNGPSRPTWVWAAAVAAGVIAGVAGVTLKNSPRTGDHAISRNPVQRTIDGSKLLAGAAVEATGDPVTVEHPGRATWVLEASSVAHLESVGDVITVALDKGAVSARVVRVPRPESFVVVAARTRIAVHGTAFRVERTASDVRVHVDEGIVMVGPVGARGFEVPAPADVVTTLDGVRQEERNAPSAGGGEHAGTEPAERTSATGEDRAAAPGERSGTRTATEANGGSGHPKPPSPSDPGSTAQRAVAAVKACFAAQTTVDQGDLKISASTTLSLHILPNGTVVEARFEPPLAPGVQQCVDLALGRVHFPESPKGLSIQRTIDLGR